MDINLGKRSIAMVIVDDHSHEVSLPTVREIESFEKKASKAKDGDVSAVIDFLGDLGLPKEVTESLDVHQFKKLTEGLMGFIEKK